MRREISIPKILPFSEPTDKARLRGAFSPPTFVIEAGTGTW